MTGFDAISKVVRESDCSTRRVLLAGRRDSCAEVVLRRDVDDFGLRRCCENVVVLEPLSRFRQGSCGNVADLGPISSP